MAHAYKNNTADLNCSQYTKYKNSKTNYNYCRLVSLKNKNSCLSNKFSNSSGTVLFNKKIYSSKKNDDQITILSRLSNVRDYSLFYSINYGYYLPTNFNNKSKGQINSNYYISPYTFFNKSCISLLNYLNRDGSSTNKSLEVSYASSKHTVIQNIQNAPETSFNSSDQMVDSSITHLVKDLPENQVVAGDEDLSDYLINTYPEDEKTTISEYYNRRPGVITNFLEDIKFKLNIMTQQEINDFLEYIVQIEYPNNILDKFSTNNTIYFFDNCTLKKNTQETFANNWAKNVQSGNSNASYIDSITRTIINPDNVITNAIN